MQTLNYDCISYIANFINDDINLETYLRIFNVQERFFNKKIHKNKFNSVLEELQIFIIYKNGYQPDLVDHSIGFSENDFLTIKQTKEFILYIDSDLKKSGPFYFILKEYKEYIKYANEYYTCPLSEEEIFYVYIQDLYNMNYDYTND